MDAFLPQIRLLFENRSSFGSKKDMIDQCNAVAKKKLHNFSTFSLFYDIKSFNKSNFAT